MPIDWETSEDQQTETFVAIDLVACTILENHKNNTKELATINALHTQMFLNMTGSQIGFHFGTSLLRNAGYLGWPHLRLHKEYLFMLQQSPLVTLANFWHFTWLHQRQTDKHSGANSGLQCTIGDALIILFLMCLEESLLEEFEMNFWKILVGMWCLSRTWKNSFRLAFFLS